MTIEELYDALRKAVEGGRLDWDDTVQVRDMRISQDAMEAGPSGYSEPSEYLIIEADNSAGLDAGFYLMLEED